MIMGAKIMILFFIIMAIGATTGAITGVTHQIYVAIICIMAAITIKFDMKNIIK